MINRPRYRKVIIISFLLVHPLFCANCFLGYMPAHEPWFQYSSPKHIDVQLHTMTEEWISFESLTALLFSLAKEGSPLYLWDRQGRMEEQSYCCLFLMKCHSLFHWQQCSIYLWVPSSATSFLTYCSGFHCLPNSIQNWIWDFIPNICLVREHSLSCITYSCGETVI